MIIEAKKWLDLRKKTDYKFSKKRFFALTCSNFIIFLTKNKIRIHNKICFRMLGHVT
jgi:hypothetical protein